MRNDAKLVALAVVGTGMSAVAFQCMELLVGGSGGQVHADRVDVEPGLGDRGRRSGVGHLESGSGGVVGTVLLGYSSCPGSHPGRLLECRSCESDRGTRLTAGVPGSLRSAAIGHHDACVAPRAKRARYVGAGGENGGAREGSRAGTDRTDRSPQRRRPGALRAKSDN